MRTLIRRCQTFVGVVAVLSLAGPIATAETLSHTIPVGLDPLALAVNSSTGRIFVAGLSPRTASISRVSRIRTTSACSRW